MEISANSETIEKFNNFLENEEEYIMNKIELDKGIGKNTLLKENVFLLFVSVVTNIPLIIIGKPGSGKSLSSQLITKSMRGEYSKSKFFQYYPKIIQNYFQGSDSTKPEDVEILFERASRRLNYYKNNKLKLPISMVLFDELGLAERSKSNPLKVLHSKLEYSGKEEGVSFVGISNYSLDAAKINRALILSVPDLDMKLAELINTSRNIVESISEKIKNDKIFEILSETYHEYKKMLTNIKDLVVYKKYMKNQKENENPKEPNQQNLENIDQSDEKTIISDTNTDIQATKKETDKPVQESEKENKPEKNQFSFIQNSKEFKKLLKQDSNIKKDFHGNRDFYYLIKGIAYDLGGNGESDDSNKVSIIIKHIERNFGGIDYEVDINFNSKLEGMRGIMKQIENILKEHENYKY